MGKGGGKKRKAEGSWKKGDAFRRKAEASCFRGFLFTVDIPRNIRKAGGDIECLIADPEIDPGNEPNPFLDNKVEEEVDNDEDEENNDVAAELAAELAELRGEKKGENDGDNKGKKVKRQRPLYKTLDCCKGVGFVQIREAGREKGLSKYSPSVRFHTAITQRLAEERPISRCLGRVHPIDRATKPHLEPLTELFKEHLKAMMPTPCSWNLVFTARNMNTIKKSDVIKAINETLGVEYDVSSCDADVTILVDVVPSFAGFGVVKDYEKLKEFQIKQIFAHVTSDFC